MTTNSESPVKQTGKRGPAPSGETRAEIEKRSAKKVRAKRYESGLVDLKTYVRAETRSSLLALKKEMGLSNLGEVVDELVKNRDEYKKTS